MNASQWVRPDIASMEPYTPVVPFDVLVERLGRSVEEIIKLNANENPYGPSPRVREALAELPFPHIYPDPESGALRSALSHHTGVRAELLLAGAGADELIDLTMRLFLLPGDGILNCPPTFGMYPFDAAICGARVVSAPRKENFRLDLARIEEAALKERPKLLFVTSPNNPDGGLLSDEELQRLLELPLVVVLDEAYIEFAVPARSRIGWVEEHENLIVLRTFSKWAGLAGLRVGYGAFPAWIVPDLWKIKQPYGVSQAASAAAVAALQDLAWAEDKVSRIIRERERLLPLLAEVPHLSPYPSRSNFVLCRVLGRDAMALKDALEQEGILIRYYRSARLRDHIRISVGTPEQTDTLIEVLRRI
jgi:histidinol-phosphate aminotransferase